MVRRFFLSLLLASEFLAAQNSPAPRLPLSSVTGQVVLETAGTPLRKVGVTLVPSEGSMVFSNQEGREQQTRVTDSDGRFEFEGVQQGEYRVFLERNGFLSTKRRSRRYSPNLLSLAPGQKLQGLLFGMRQAGVIKGKIVDEDGDPVPGISVYPRLISGRNESIVSDTTNDLGEFRIAGLPEGKFLVLAQTAGGMILRGGNFKQQAVYAPTYYPGTLDQTQAASVEVHAGEESTANFNLMSSRTFTVKGRVFGLTPQGRRTGSSGIVGPAGQITLERADGPSLESQSTTIQQDGPFEIDDVFPGSYVARIDSQQGSGTATVEVRDTDVSGVQLAIEPAVEVRGRFRMEDGRKIDWAQVLITLDPDDARQRGNPMAGMVAKVQRDGSFVLQNIEPGNYHVVVTSNSSALRDYIVKEVNADGKDAGDSGFAVGNGAPFLDVVGSVKGSTIEGVALDDQGKPVPDVDVVCIPDSARRKRHDVYQQVQTDQRGYFRLRGLNAGEYQVFALDDEANDITDQDFVAAHEGHGETVTVEAGEHKTVSLKLPAPQD
jgi:uncharacterized GH25 family protein